MESDARTEALEGALDFRQPETLHGGVSHRHRNVGRFRKDLQDVVDDLGRIDLHGKHRIHGGELTVAEGTLVGRCNEQRDGTKKFGPVTQYKSCGRGTDDDNQIGITVFEETVQIGKKPAFTEWLSKPLALQRVFVEVDWCGRLLSELLAQSRRYRIPGPEVCPEGMQHKNPLGLRRRDVDR